MTRCMSINQQMKKDAQDIPNEHLQVFSIDLLRDLCKLLSIMSKPDALTLFILAKQGIKAEIDTPKDLGLTRKRYYTRLKRLVDSNLIEKREGSYFHTTFGSFVHDELLGHLLEGVKNTKQMRMLDVLKSSQIFSGEDISGLMRLYKVKE